MWPLLFMFIILPAMLNLLIRRDLHDYLIQITITGTINNFKLKSTGEKI